jgi:hypothetical protein
MDRVQALVVQARLGWINQSVQTLIDMYLLLVRLATSKEQRMDTECSGG